MEQRFRSRWKMLFHGEEEKRSLIDCDSERVEIPDKYPHPLFSPDSQLADRMTPLLRKIIEEEGFVSESDRMPAVHDRIVEQVFSEMGFGEKLPRFPLAGARCYYRLDPAHLTVGVLTAGGNAPGLNMVLDSIVKRQYLLATLCSKPDEIDPKTNYPKGLTIWGYNGGFLGLERNDKRPLYPRTTDRYAAEGCTMLHTPRATKIDKKKYPQKYAEYINKLVDRIIKEQLDILYLVGGDGTMGVAEDIAQRLLDRENQKDLNGRCRRCLIICGPKTMDNDILFTYTTFGFRTVVDNAVEIIRTFHKETETLERVGIIEFFGAKSGFVALHTGYTSGEVDYALIPEAMGDNLETAWDELQQAVQRLERRVRDKKHALLVIAEGATLKAQTAICVKDPDFVRSKARDALEQYRQAVHLINPQLAQEQEEKVILPAEMQDSFDALDNWVGQIAPSQRPDKTLKEFEHGMREVKKQAFADVARYISNRLKTAVKASTFEVTPKHLIRGTPPNAFDLDLCKNAGKLMVDTALAGYTRCTVNLWQGDYVIVPLKTALMQVKQVDVSGYFFVSMMEKYFLER